MTRAQFSPGALSKAHDQLEGMENCVKCHEVGAEISGAKCLTCHTEISTAVAAKHGYHFTVSSQKCIACHKEHLGRDAQITVFAPSTFDHVETGFALLQKHAEVKCAQCHAADLIVEASIAALVSRTGRATYLGLGTACSSCHKDRHGGMLGSECASCHMEAEWTPAPKFEHAKARFVLTGKHVDVPCARCHAQTTPRQGTITFRVKSFEDCAPCHVSPHTASFAAQACRSCHTTQSWTTSVTRGFDHNKTAFKLLGKHAALACKECHKGGASTPGASFRIPFQHCIDCHADYHQGDFLAQYKNDCAKCHSEQAYRPSTFTLVRHQETRWPLTGSHLAVPCMKCHPAAAGARARYHFADLSCTACHHDVHEGQFSREMGPEGCAACHSTAEWSAVKFDHASTSFPLSGKHAAVRCNGCHTPAREGAASPVRYKGTPTACASCHKDSHEGQFATGGTTECARCHAPTGWHSLVFDHNRQSRFTLTGAHAKTPCVSCHRESTVEGKSVIRYTPLDTKCESCHNTPVIDNG